MKTERSDSGLFIIHQIARRVCAPASRRPSAGSRSWISASCVGGCILFATSALALAEGGQGSGPSEVLFIAQVMLLLFVGRMLGELMLRIGQPAVMGQLIAGVLLGPSVFGALWPHAQHLVFPPDGGQKAMINAVAQFGVLMLLLLTGMETDLGLVRKVRRQALSASLGGICVPFVLGFGLGELLPDTMLPRPDQRLITALLLGTALSISSVKIVAMVVREMNFLRRDIGQIIVASAIIDDTIGWIIIAITLSLALHGSVDLASIARSVLGTLAFLVASFTFGRRIVFLVIRWTNDNFLSEVPVITAILLVMGGMALTTDFIGVSTVLGAFVAGILVGESPILTKHIDDELRGLIMAFFAPVFFGLSGLNADLRILGHPEMLAVWVGLILIASIGKFSGAFLGGWIGGLTQAQCLALACGMNARGSTEVIVATIGLSMGALTQDLFTMIVAMAVVTTMAMPPMLRWALGRLPFNDEERRRLDREASEARGFVSNLERLLIAVDDSVKGRFAARLAGLLAGSRGMPVTVLKLGQSEPAAAEPETALMDAADASVAAPGNDQEEPLRVDVTTRVQSAPPEEAVASAAKRGHDLLVIGLERTVGPDGGFQPEIVQAARGFDGPLAIVSARGAHLREPFESELNILVPMTSAEASRRGAEVAFALARATSGAVTALHVASPGAITAVRRATPQAKEDNAALLRELDRLGEQYGVKARTAVRVNIAPEDAILRQARLGGHNLIVMGVSRRPGETLSFGNVAAAVLESAERSVVFVSTGA